MAEATLGVKINGFQVLSLIYSGSRTLVYRAIRESDQKSVILKVMRNPYPNFKEIVQFRNQYAIAKNLNKSGIVKPYSLEANGNGYVLVMEDIGGLSLREWRILEKPDFIGEFLNIAIQIVKILGEIHQQRIIHKDIKPANILINPETKQVKLIDFSIASLLQREAQQLQNPNLLEGTLAYISPEQTGRMNRGIDYRTDFYSLGITFFELLAEKLPFISNDAMELVHCHIAKLAPNVCSINQHIPEIISAIITKLIAKNAEDRYQSAAGLKYDLEVCLQKWLQNKNIPNFELGTRDIYERFIIPEKLYGREKEVATLIKAFQRVSQLEVDNKLTSKIENPLAQFSATAEQSKIQNRKSKIEMVLVTGFSGIGKTAVVNEVHKPIVQQRGYFIKGKYDQFQRNIPFSAFFQAFRDLMAQLLGESDAQLQKWKTQILTAIGENGQIIIDVIPELEQIIGKQIAVSELSGNAAQNRFNITFQNFLQVFAKKEHPLVIFLDDLQWADSASLNLIKLLISEIENSNLLLICAYRDNEVNPGHPLRLFLEEIHQTEASINIINLSSLVPSDINSLIADTLNCVPDIAQTLTKLVYSRTKGNPFFTSQFLKYLHQENLINFNLSALCWECDITKIKEIVMTDDVVEFITFKLQQLPEETQNVLKLAACIGNQFDLKMLAIAYKESEGETAIALWKSLQEGLILPTSAIYKLYHADIDISSSPVINTSIEEKQSPKYKFLHDRVQQAAYSLISESEKQKTHLKIGKLLLDNISESSLEESIFEIVNQLNYGVALINKTSERKKLARLNLIAGRKAKNATAYTDAFKYFQSGINLLSNDSWQSEYELTLALYELAAESAYLIGDFKQVKCIINIVSKNVKKISHKTKINEIKIQSYVAQNKLLNAIQTALIFLNELGVILPEQVSQTDVQKALEDTAEKLADKEIEDLIQLPVMTDPNMLAAMEILSTVAAAVYIGLPELYPLVVLKQIELSLIYGNANGSAYAYATYGLILCAVAGDIDAGYRSGQLALSLLEKFQAKKFQAKIINLVYPFVRIWKNPLINCLKPLLNGYQAGLETGDLEFASYCIYNYCKLAYFAGVDLAEVTRNLSLYADAISHLKQETALNFHQIGHQAVLNLLGKVDNPCQLVGQAYDETIKLPQHQAANDRYSSGSFYIHKLVLAYTFGNYEQALEMVKLAEKYLDAGAGAFQTGIFYFYAELTYLATSSLQPTSCSIYQQKIQRWSEYAPTNFLHKFYLVEAERNRVIGNYLDAIENYDKSIQTAKQNLYLNEEALANELAAKFYLKWGKEKIAQTYMIEAFYCYARWGAVGKIEYLKQNYSSLLIPIQNREKNPIKVSETVSLSSKDIINSSNLSTTSILDFATVMKASQVLSQEIELENLLYTLMQVIIENAGASSATLILLENDNLKVIAQCLTNQDCCIYPDDIDINQQLPVSIIYKVKRSQEKLLINDVSAKFKFTSDPYLSKHKPQSLLCNPIINQGQLIAILYLENNLTTGVFTEDRIEILNILCAQAAISIENAKFYDTLEQKVKQRTQELSETLQTLKATQKQLIESEKMAALGSLVAGIAHEINTPVGTSITAASTLADETKYFLQSVAEGQLKRSSLNSYLEIARESTNLIIKNLERAGELVQSFKQVAVDQSHLEKREFNLKKYIEEVVFSLAPNLKQTPHTCEVKGDGSIIIDTYPGAIAQIVTNLVLNSLTHAYPDGKVGCLTFEVARAVDSLRIQYSDDGCGIAEEHISRIFEPFFTTTRNEGGTGLGLHIVYNIVTQKLQGSIDVKSQPDMGTIFIVKLPV